MAVNFVNYGTYEIPSFLVTAIEYGDYTGLTDTEVETLEAFLEKLPEGHKVWEWADEGYYSWYNDVTAEGSEVTEATLFVDEG